MSASGAKTELLPASELPGPGRRRRPAITEDLAVENARLAAAFENMSHGLCMFDAEQRMIICNSRYVGLFSMSPEVLRPGVRFIDILQHSVDIGIAAGTADELYVIRKPLIENGRAATYEEALADGRIINISHRPLSGGGWVAIYEDITEQRLAQEALKEQHRRFDAALANMSQGLLMHDADTRLIVRNERFLELFNLPPQAIRLGMTHREVLEQLVERGIYRDFDIDQQMAIAGAQLRAGHIRSVHRQLSNGRTILITQRPMRGGGWLATFDDVTERRRFEERMTFLANHDPLTGVPNRAAFREHLEQALSERSRAPLAVLSLDLDRFKAVNDSWGHPAGDWLLRSVAERLRRCLSDGDLVARFGGDEFAILQSGIRSSADAERLAKRVIDAVGRPFPRDGFDMHVGVSVGVAISPDDGEDADELLSNADMALYKAKSEGRNVYRFFEPGMDALVREKRALEADLREALARREFELNFQPIMEIASGEIVSVEALMRWRSPGRGLVSPEDFIPVAEETKLIVPIGEWALRKACAAAASWPADLRLAVNVSAMQLRTGAFARSVISALAHSRLPATSLELEITETVLMDESDTVLKTIGQLRELGIRMALDDFGTGYSSLGYLRRFPVDKIKIDRSFINAIDDPGTAAIVRAIIGLGRELGITVTAEGVETAAQLDVLRREGCVEAQGYLIGPPGSSKDVLRFLRREVVRGSAS